MSDGCHRMATATILFTDVAGSTGMLARVGDLENDRLRRRHDELVRNVVARHRGKLVESTGDGVLATFDSASDGSRPQWTFRGRLRSSADRAACRR